MRYDLYFILLNMDVSMITEQIIKEVMNICCTTAVLLFKTIILSHDQKNYINLLLRNVLSIVKL